MNTKLKPQPLKTTQDVADFLRSLGYPILSVEPETKDLTGGIVLFDTNPEKDPTRNRRVLHVEVDFTVLSGNAAKKLGRKPGPQAELLFYATKFTTKNKFVEDNTTRISDPLMLETDVGERISIADLVVWLGVDRQDAVFDSQGLEIEQDIQWALEDLKEVEHQLAQYREALAKHQEQRRKAAGKVVKIKK